MKTKCFGLVVLVAVLVMLTACTIKTYQTYPGKTRPKNEVATIEPEPGIRIESIGAKTVNIESEESGYSGYTKAKLPKGENTLRVIPSTISAVKSYAILKATLKGGREYVVRHKRVTGNNSPGAVYEIWVEDKKSEEQVSNRAKSGNPFGPQ